VPLDINNAPIVGQGNQVPLCNTLAQPVLSQLVRFIAADPKDAIAFDNLSKPEKPLRWVSNDGEVRYDDQ
jgi:hypothetical protein